MLFFDDWDKNIEMVSSLGVHCVLVTNGMTFDLFNEGMREFSMKKLEKTPN